MAWLRRRWLWLLLIASIAFNVGVGTTFGVRAYSRHSGGPPGRERGPRHREMLEQLELRPEQEAQVEADRETLHAEMMELRQALAAESAVLADLMMAVEPDREAIAAQVGKLAELHRQEHQLIVEHFLRVNELLDDQQREVFKETVGKVVAKCGAGPRGFGRHHRGKGPPGRGHGRGLQNN